MNLKTIPEALVPEIRIGGEYLTIERAAARGLELTCRTESEGDALLLTLAVRNRSKTPFHLEKFNWRYVPGKADFLSGHPIELYLEGWQMATPCGVRKYGDCDYEFDPGYLKFAIAEPEDYSPEKNHFRAENMVMFHAPECGETLLAGFVTSADQFGHFQIELGAGGVAALNVRSACDGMLLAPGEEVASETLALMAGDDDGFALQQRYAELWGRKMKARTAFPAPLGWCSWYYYFSKVTEHDVAENVRFLAEHREAYPLRYVQLDDGYERALGDWLLCNDQFPSGLAAVARTIRESGFVPALWLGPFMAEDNSLLLRDHPEWMIRDAQGQVIMGFNWRAGHKAAILDGTNPEVQEHFRTLFRKIRELGFDYVKLDFMVTASAMRNGVLHDPKATRAQALRRGLQAIRDGFGEDGYILGCTVPFGPMIGLVDGERISTDITPYWEPDRKFYAEAPTVPNVCRNVIRHTYMHQKLWNNDPDTLIVRDDNTKLTGNEVMVWFNAIRLGGVIPLLSDRFATLTPERAALPQMLLAEQLEPGRPGDFWSNEVPAVWRTSRETGYFNFTATERLIEGVRVAPHSCITREK